MSTSKRGRKRNDNLPPNRARDVQRAFRARRAAHLQSLQDRVDILEAENSQLREMLHLPPSDRPVIGRGPTGKDKPLYPSTKSYALPELSKVLPVTSMRNGSPGTEHSSAHSNSSSSPTTSSQVWGDLGMQHHVVPGVWPEQDALGSSHLDAARSPSMITLPKPAPFPGATIGSQQPSPPLRHLSATESAFYPSSSNPDSYTAGTPGSSPAFALREMRGEDAYHSNPYPPSFHASYQSMHTHSVSCELPLPSQSYSSAPAQNHSPPSRESSVGSISGHRRSITSPDLHVLNVNSSFSQPQAHGLPPPPPSSHLRHSDARSPLPHQIPNIMHSAAFGA